MKRPKKAEETRAPGDVAGELERRLDCFRATLADEHLRRLADWIESGHALAQPRHALVIETVRDVQEVLGGFTNRLHHLGMCMAGVADGDAGGEIEKTIAVYVPDLRAAAV